MKGKILKCTGCVLLTLLVLCAVTPVDFVEIEIKNNKAVYNEIDAFTSASGDIRVTVGKAHYTIAVLETYHKDSFTRHYVQYGTERNYSETLIVADTPRVVICTLTNLEPNTEYDFEYIGDWPDNPSENHKAVGTFKTVSFSL